MKLETRQWWKRPVSWAVVAAIRLYQLTLARALGPCCRFHPSCSEYWIEAIESHGLGRGIWLGLKRLGRCHPFHPGGVDPVPPALESGVK